MHRPVALGSDVVTLASVLEVRARETPAALAFAFGAEQLSYGALRDEVATLAAGLVRLGVESGHRVGIVLPAGLDVVRLFFALQRIGAIPCVLDPSVPAVTTAARVSRIKPRLVVADDAQMHVAMTASGLTTATVAELARGGAPLPALANDGDAMAFLQPTSGTSGEPRAAIVLQRNVSASLFAARDVLDPIASDVLVGWVPPWHDLGLMRFLLGPVYFGIPCHLVPPAIRTIPQWFATVSSVRGTITGAPDFAYRLAARLVDPRNVDLSSLRYATNGGEPVRSSTMTMFEGRFDLRNVVCPGYGLAEATLGVSCVRPGEAKRSDARGHVSTGRAMVNVELRIDGDETGEILVRGPAVFAGYFEAEEATAAASRDGWLHTGDVGSLDAGGQLYVLGRQRAMLKRGGAPLAPRELEEAAQSVAGVRIAAAVGIAPLPDATTEQIVLVLEADPGAAADLTSRVADAVEQVLGFAPDRIIVQQPRTIPRTANGKIQHAVLRSQLEKK